MLRRLDKIITAVFVCILVLYMTAAVGLALWVMAGAIAVRLANIL